MSGTPVRLRRYGSAIEWLRPRTTGKRVLYVGTVDDNPDNAAKHPPVHRELARTAAAVTGVYRDVTQADRLAADGLDAISADVDALDLGRTFDVVVAADTIEHVSDAGRFLRALDRHLDTRGTLLVTTPNPLSFVRMLEQLIRGRTRANVAHTCWYSGQVLDQLARRCGLAVAEEAHIDDMAKYHRPSSGNRRSLGKRIAARMLIAGNTIACRALPQLAETSGFVLVPHRAQPR